MFNLLANRLSAGGALGALREGFQRLPSNEARVPVASPAPAKSHPTPVMRPLPVGPAVPVQPQPAPSQPMTFSAGGAAQFLENMRGFGEAHRGFSDAMRQWSQSRPTFGQDMSQEAYRSALDTWQQGRPSIQSFLNQGAPASTNTGIVPPTMPTTAPVAPAPVAQADFQNFYQTHGYYPGKAGN